MLEGLLALLVILVVLALIGWGAQAVMSGLGAPAWLKTVVLVIFLVVAVVLCARAFGIALP
jgi:hypothetical protein